MNRVMTREEWLTKLISSLRARFAESGWPMLDTSIRASVGFPSTRAVVGKNRRIGECWYPEASEDGSHQIFVSPLISDALRVADIVVHELVHVVTGKKAGHKGAFKRCALKLGLTGKMTATQAGPELIEALTGILAEIGPYPHSAINPTLSDKKKQSTRMIKLCCPKCGYIARTTKKWIEVGVPTCSIDNIPFILDSEDDEQEKDDNE